MLELRRQVEQANRAKIALEFAELTYEDAKRYALSELLKPESDLLQVRADYKAATALYQRVKAAVASGEMALETLNKLESEE